MSAAYDTESEPYMLGRLNCRQGMSRRGNPYDGRTINGRAWLAGYDEEDHMKRPTPIKGVRLTKGGKLEKAASRKTSVAQKIAAKKSKRVRVARRTA